MNNTLKLASKVKENPQKKGNLGKSGSLGQIRKSAHIVGIQGASFVLGQNYQLSSALQQRTDVKLT